MNLQLAVTVLLLALGLLAVNARPRGQRVSSEVVGPIAVMFGGRGTCFTCVLRTSYRAARRYAPADRGGSTSVRGRIRSPYSPGGL